MYAVSCVGGHVVINISPFFLCVEMLPLGFFSLSLFFFNISISLKISLLPLSLRYMFKATSCFSKVNPLLQRPDQIRVNDAHRP